MALAPLPAPGWEPVYQDGHATLYHADALDWLSAQAPCSIHACVTDPPYGLVEYTPREQRKLRAGRGGASLRRSRSRWFKSPPRYEMGLSSGETSG